MIDRRQVALAALVLLAAGAIGVVLRPLMPIDETRYLAVAWEMHLSGDWLLPSKNFAPYSDKPPLVFWAINLMWALTGVSEFAARMVVPLFSAAAVWLTAVLAGRLWPQAEGVSSRAAWGLTGLAVFALSSGLTMFDVPLTVAVLGGMICLAAAATGEPPRSGRPFDRLWPWAGLGVALALGGLTKGPVVLFHLLPAALLLPWWSGGRVPWRAMPLRLAGSIALALALVALWLVPVALTGGQEYRDAILWHQSAGRLTGSLGTAHARPWWFFLALLPVLAFPLWWSPGLWADARRADRTDPGLRLCMVWAAGAFLLFSMTSGKQIHYLVPELPALALVAARLSGARGFALWPASLTLGAAGVAALLAAVGVVSLGRAEVLFSPSVGVGVWATVVLTFCVTASMRQGVGGAAELSLGALLATNLLIGMTDSSTIFSSHPMAAAIAPRAAHGIAYVGAPYHSEFAFAARATQAVANPKDGPELAAWMADHPQGLIVARRGEREPAWPPSRLIRFRSGVYGLWDVQDATEETGANPGADLGPGLTLNPGPTPTPTPTSAGKASAADVPARPGSAGQTLPEAAADPPAGPSAATPWSQDPTPTSSS